MSEKEHSIIYFKIFLITLILTAFFSFVYKGIWLIANSSFKFASYNLILSERDKTLVHFDTIDRTISLTKIKENDSPKSIIERSVASKILIDGIIETTSDTFTPLSFMTWGDALKLIFSRSSVKIKNTNEFDILKMLVYSIVYEKKTVKFAQIRSLADKKISSEAKSIQIINASGMDGLGSLFSIALENTGYNVVEVTTGKEQKSKIRAQDDGSDSVQRLKSALRIPFEKTREQGIADITIVLGQDIPKQ